LGAELGEGGCCGRVEGVCGGRVGGAGVGLTVCCAWMDVNGIGLFDMVEEGVYIHSGQRHEA
jgi:hypothetical protein